MVAYISDMDISDISDMDTVVCANNPAVVGFNSGTEASTGLAAEAAELVHPLYLYLSSHNSLFSFHDPSVPAPLSFSRRPRLGRPNTYRSR